MCRFVLSHEEGERWSARQCSTGKEPRWLPRPERACQSQRGSALYATGPSAVKREKKRDRSHFFRTQKGTRLLISCPLTESFSFAWPLQYREKAGSGHSHAFWSRGRGRGRVFHSCGDNRTQGRPDVLWYVRG